MGEKKSIAKLYKKFIDNTISTQELRVLLDYLRKTDDEKLRHLKKVLLKEQPLDVLPHIGSVKNKYLRTQLEARIRGGSEEHVSVPGKKRVSSTQRVAAIVAMVIIGSFITFIFYRRSPVKRNTRVVYKTTSHQKKKVVLPDSSEVWLNDESKLTFLEPFAEDIREVELEGEAFFKIRHVPGVPFVVKSLQVKTTVLGTSFSVKSYAGDKETEVAVLTGKVKVTYNEGTSENVLGANEFAHFNPSENNFSLAKRNVKDLVAWKDDVLVLNDKNLGQVANILERWFKVKVIFENRQLKNCLVRGKFNSPSLLDVLEGLKFVHHFEYVLRSDTVKLRGEGCKDVRARVIDELPHHDKDIQVEECEKYRHT